MVLRPKKSRLVTLRGSGEYETYQVQRPSNQMIPHTRTILTSSPADHDYAVLLSIVTCNHLESALSIFRFPIEEVQANQNPPYSSARSIVTRKMPALTFTRNISTNHPPTTQLNLRRLPLPRVRLLRLHDPHLQTDALDRWPAGHGWRGLAPRFSRLSRFAPELV